MKPLCHRPTARGQAALEAVLSLGLLALLIHGSVTVGALQFQGLQAAQLSRHAVFAAARGQADVPPWHAATLSIAPSRSIDAGVHIGNAQAAVLADDWLQVDHRLRTAQASVHPAGSTPFALRNGPASVLSVRRHITLAANAGHASSDLATAQRIPGSATGWSDASRGSVAAAQALHRRMQAVDAPWGRGRWSVDWLEPWADLVPIHTRIRRR